MTSILWSELRTWNGTQQLAFEELCCQLLSTTPPAPGAVFIRKGTRDAGIEGYWKLKDGSEHGIQAKFFHGSPDESQLRQIDSSVETAIKKHPRLTKYTVCLPTDRDNPRIEGQSDFMQRWDDRVLKWKRLAAASARTIEFVYFGESEISRLLAIDLNVGLSKFWFDRETFSGRWFQLRKAESTAQLRHSRYLPDLHIDISELDRHVQALTLDATYFIRLAEIVRDSYEKCLKLNRVTTPTDVTPQLESILNFARDLQPVAEMLSMFDANDQVSPSETQRLLQSVSSLAEGYQASFNSAWPSNTRIPIDSFERLGRNNEDDAVKTIENELNEAEESCSLCVGILTDTEMKAATNSAIIITGEAGIGKTHFLANVVHQRAEANLPALLFHGEHFRSSPILAQIRERLGIECSTDQFLGALSAAAKSCRCRALIVIDALNEADDKTLWKRELPSFLAAVAQWPDIAVVLSIRSTYVSYCLPESLKNKGLPSIGHPGFSGSEEQAFVRYFTHYGVPPSVPVLDPEFSNPLFLKTFCEAVSFAPSGMAKGRSSLKSLLHIYLESVNSRIAEELQCDPVDQPVILAIRSIAKKMIEIDRRLISRSDAKRILDAIHHTLDFSKSLYRRLLHEGIISETIWKDVRDGSESDFVRFSYERFGDFWLAETLLQNAPAANGDATTIRTELNSLLDTFAGDEHTRYRKATILEPLLMLVADKYQLEITEVLGDVFESSVITSAILSGIPWRSRLGVTDKTELFLRECLASEQYQHEAFDCMLRMATRQDHRLNARWLHAYLMSIRMPDRDAIWSIFLHERWKYSTSTKRIVDWAWIQNEKNTCTPSVRLVCGITLSWFFTSSNRFLRDRATKALVAIFDSAPHEFCEILRLFETVDDLYVLERVQAVAFGLVARTRDLSDVMPIAEVVFQQVFAKGRPPAHALLRDYARLTVERANHLACRTVFDVAKIRPPFTSSVPLNAQTWDSLKQKYSDSSYSGLILSLWPDHGDFARYVLASGSPSGAHGWQQEPNRNCGQTAAKGIDSVAQKQLEQLLTDVGNEIIRVDSKGNHLDASLNVEVDDDVLNLIEIEEQEGSVTTDSELESDLACRWILERVFQLGWTPERFGEFDVNMDSHGRDAKKPERIGKKYQWIAYHEWMSHVTDQRPFRLSRTDVYQYAGAWDLGLRDIDPTCVLGGTQRQSNLSDLKQRCWWAAVDYDSWQPELSDFSWMNIDTDLPPVQGLLLSTDPATARKYVSLEAYATWESKTPPSQRRNDSTSRRVWYILQGYILRTEDVPVFRDWASRQDFYGRWMPESHDTHGLYSGEFFWSPAYAELDRAHRSDAGIKSDGSIRDHKPPCEFVVPATRFIWEGSGFDCSIDNSISATMPGIFLSEKMKLSVGKDCGTILDDSGTQVALDPSVSAAGPSTLLFEKAALDSFLQSEGLSLVWTLLGAKENVGTSIERGGGLRLNGVMTYMSGRIEGEVSAFYQSFPSYKNTANSVDIRRWKI
jgi:hypothetical protein